jgi:HK97 family phage major capsid protein
MSRALRLAQEVQQMFESAEQQGRSLTPEERTYAEGLLEEAQQLGGLEKQLDAVGRAIGAPFGNNTGNGKAMFTPFDAGGPGDMFVASPQWKAIADPSSRGQSWTTGPVDVGMLTKAGTLLESGQGAGAVPVPQVVPGIVPTLFQPLGIADIFQQGIATTSSIRYVNEGTATSGAAGVAEGATKPASDIAMSTVDEAVRKIATVLTISDELVEDAPQIQAYLNSRLALFCRIEEDRQLLRGVGVGSNEVLGIFGRSGINTYTKLGTDDNATALARVIANTAGSSFLQPDHIIMHPTNWLSTRLLRDGTGGTVGQFYGGGPFSYGPYGGAPGGAATLGSFGGMIWNTPVFLSTFVGSGTALVGSFTQGAQLWRRGGVSVEISNQHQDYFQKNLLMVRAESRRALCLYRPSAFTAVSGLS